MHLPIHGGVATLPARKSSPTLITRIVMRKVRHFLLAFVIFSCLAHAQERFSIFVPSEQENVERMLRLAGLRDDDVVVDLGSGDGRIVLTAARMNPKVRGWGVDIDAKLVAESNAEARVQGVADRVHFYY